MLMPPPLPHSPSSWARVFKTLLFSLIVAFQEAKVGVCVCLPHLRLEAIAAEVIVIETLGDLGSHTRRGNHRGSG